MIEAGPVRVSWRSALTFVCWIVVEAEPRWLFNRIAVRWQQVARDLLSHELVERQIAIEGRDDPTAIPKRIRVREVFIESV
jgi:hypothetical protein